jgi:hypothetical protein
VDYRDVLATVVGASVAGIIAFAIRLAFPVNAAVVALVYAATYSLLWSIVGDHARLLFQRRLPPTTRFDGHWRLVTGSVALAAAAGAGLIVAFALSRPSFGGAATAPTDATRRVTQTVALQPRVVVTHKTILLPVETRVVSTPFTTPGGNTTTVLSRTVVVQRPPITITVSSTRSRTTTVTQTTPTVTAPATTAVVTTTLAPTTVVQPGTDTVPPTTPTDTATAG